LFPCVDAILLRIADPGQIAGLSRLAHEADVSTVAAAAAPYPSVGDNAEALLALRPDLVVVSRYTARPTLLSLRRAGIRLLEVTPQLTVQDSLEQVQAVADAIGQSARGGELTTRIRAALDRAVPAGSSGFAPRALVFQNAGFVAGTGTLIDDMLRQTGFRNMAQAYGLTGFGDVSLERVVADPPDVLLAGIPRPGAPAWGDRVLRHPALLRLAGRMRLEAFPEGLLLCGGPVLLQTAPRLAAIHRRMTGAAS
jgi:iron complex transport system substrate-binding protein